VHFLTASVSERTFVPEVPALTLGVRTRASHQASGAADAKLNGIGTDVHVYHRRSLRDQRLGVA
jgi:hypothetical protein